MNNAATQLAPFYNPRLNGDKERIDGGSLASNPQARSGDEQNSAVRKWLPDEKSLLPVLTVEGKPAQAAEE